MNNASKKALINKLAVPKNFHRRFKRANRRWFVAAMIRHFDTGGASDATVTTNVTDMVTKSRKAVDKHLKVVNSHRNFEIQIKAKRSRFQTPRSVEILYGLFAEDPTLVKDTNEDQLLFIAKRRMRSVVRMDHYVNPSGQGYCRYPKACPPGTVWRLNEDAQVFWAGLHQTPIAGHPRHHRDQHFPLKTNVGSSDFVKAVTTVFEKPKPDACKGNLVECALAAGAVVLDSLLEADDPKKLFARIDADDPKGLAVHHPTNSPAQSMFKDGRATSLFVAGDGPVRDLQVGDLVYIFNHSLYRVFKPKGPWRGEHALVYNLGNHSYRSRAGLVFGGHGKEGTIYQFYSAFLAELQTSLHRAYRIGGTFLKYMRNELPLGPQDNVKVEEAQMGGVATRFYEFKYTFRHNVWVSKNQQRPRRMGTKSESNFVIAYQPTNSMFAIATEKTIAAIGAATEMKDPIVFRRAGVDPGGLATFDPPSWGITYFDEPTASNERYDVFVKQRGKVTYNTLTIDNLFKSPFYKRDPRQAANIYRTKPKVDTTSTYSLFLQTNGAIPDRI